MAAPIYLKVADVAPRPLTPLYQKEVLPETLLRNTWGNEGQNRCRIGTLLQTSFDPEQLKTVRPERNGFIGTVLTAYGQHHHLIIRPDDIWLAILTQFNFYVNANAEQLRSKFVAHEGKETLRVDANRLPLVDKDFKDWILPSFTTTTDNDTIVCAAAMMATLKSYYVYEGGIVCARKFGVEPTFWAALLRPILSKFVQAFDGEVDTAFWKTMVDRYDMCGGTRSLAGLPSSASGRTRASGGDQPLTARAHTHPSPPSQSAKFILDLEMMPVGFFDIELKLIDDMEVLECIVVAGHIASLAEGAAQDTIRPLSGWFPTALQAKLKAQEWPKSKKRKRDVAFRDKKAKRNTGGNPGKENGELSHGSGCFCITGSMFASVLSLFRPK
ncbi:hypothetical protein BJ912DRAFT_994147 [Pholiota molesta]|nr:hypothetical protein BJ912DRAFT_994147 [Pholiota molesta]